MEGENLPGQLVLLPVEVNLDLFHFVTPGPADGIPDVIEKIVKQRPRIFEELQRNACRLQYLARLYLVEDAVRAHDGAPVARLRSFSCAR